MPFCFLSTGLICMDHSRPTWEQGLKCNSRLRQNMTLMLNTIYKAEVKLSEEIWL